MMVARLLLMLSAACASSSPVAAEGTWRGNLQCGIVPGFTTKPLIAPFTIVADGAKLSYARPVLNQTNPTPSGIAEHGSGTLSGAMIQLSGAASGPGYSYTATYEGKFDGAFGSLTGEQVWKAAQFVTPFHRSCSVTLTR